MQAKLLFMTYCLLVERACPPVRSAGADMIFFREGKICAMAPGVDGSLGLSLLRSKLQCPSALWLPLFILRTSKYQRLWLEILLVPGVPQVRIQQLIVSQSPSLLGTRKKGTYYCIRPSRASGTPSSRLAAFLTLRLTHIPFPPCHWSNQAGYHSKTDRTPGKISIRGLRIIRFGIRSLTTRKD